MTPDVPPAAETAGSPEQAPPAAAALDAAEARVGALHAEGKHAEALALALATTPQRIAQLRATRRPRKRRKLDKATRIFLCGYFYSGSGAVVDYLKDFSGVAKWSPAGEMRLIKFVGGMWDQLSRFKAQNALRDDDLVEYYLHITGAKVEAAPEGHYTVWRKVNRHSRKLMAHPQGKGYLVRALKSFQWLSRVSREEGVEARRLEKGLRKYVHGALNAAARDMNADCLLIDQAINAWRLTLARLAPPSTFIVVHRDPRDQYADACVALSAPGRKLPDAAEFAATYRKRRAQGEAAMAVMEAKYGHRVISFAFEDFVLDHPAVTKRLIRDLGFDQRTNPKPGYDVGASRENIGKHRTMLSREDVETLETLLPEYLHPAVSNL